MEYTGEFQIAKLDVRPGDTVVVRVDVPATADVMRRIGDHVKVDLPEGVKVLVIDRRVTLEIVRPADDETSKAA